MASKGKARRVESELLWAWQSKDGVIYRKSAGIWDLCHSRKLAREWARDGERVVRVRVTVEVVE